MWMQLLSYVAVSAAATATSVPIDFSAVGQTFDGIGALSGGGGTSRLLYDYPEPQRTEVLDALFTPSAGGALQILKVEMGGDGQSTEATEASHMHTPTDENYKRGYEWWLMVEAKKRNPDIKLFTLAWTAPGWIGDGSRGPESQGGYYSQDNIKYHLNWIKGAKQTHNLTLDYMGIWNEHAYDIDWIIRLREAMDKDPYAKDVKIVASDQGGWPICADMVKNETLMNAVSIIGSHYPVQGPKAPPTPAECQTLNTRHGKPLWTSEGWNLGQVNDWTGAMNLALTINQNYVQEEQTAMIVWTVIYAWYSIFPFAHPDGKTVGGMGHGLMSATEPWSGHYRIQPTLYTVAHTSQFTQPGSCKYLKNSAVGIAPGGWLDAANVSSIVVFVCDEGKHWTAVIETATAKTLPPNTDFVLSNVPTEAPAKLQVWQTCETTMFENLPSVTPSGGKFSLSIKPQCVTTITTMTTGGPVPPATIPASAHMSLEYSDNFENYAVESPVKYFADEGGSFAAEKLDGNGILAQQVPEKPIHGAWWNDGEPWTVMGDSQSWVNYTVSVKAMIAGKPKAGPHPSPPGPPAPPKLQISQMSARSPSHGQCLNVLAAQSADGTPIFTYPCGEASARLDFVTNEYPAVGATTGAANDEWDIKGGLLKCMGKCATVEPNGGVALYSCNGSAAQSWSIDWPLIKSASRCLGLAAHGPSSYPNNKLAKVSKCATSDPTQKWTNGSASLIDVMPEPAFVRVCGRISAFKPNGTPPQGYCLIVDSNSANRSSWFLAAGGSPGSNGRDKPKVIATGQLPAPKTPGITWRTLTLKMLGNKITPSVDGISLGTVETDAFMHGMAAVGGGWHRSFFDDFSLKPDPSSRK